MTGPHTIAVPLMGACGVLLWRLRETSRPVTLKALIIPPLGMSTGLGMFLDPPARVPLAWAATAFVLGAIFFATPMNRHPDVARLEHARGRLAGSHSA
ncbi:MAG: CcdC protein domain-containing protein [Vulcanimicrobiota bacterium]